MAGQNQNCTLIKDLKPGMNALSLTVIALEIGRPNTVKDNQEVRTVKIADKSGMVNLSLWNEPGKVLQPGDIVRITRAYTGMFKTCLTVFTAKFGDFFKIGEFTMTFSETPNMSEPNPELAAQFEKDEFVRKSLKANRDTQGNNTGKSGSGQPASRPAASTTGAQGNVSGKVTWGTQIGSSSRGGSASGQGNGRPQHRGSSKEKR